MQPDLTALAAHAEVAAALLKAMGNRNRLMVLCTLHAGELSVGELNALIPLSQSALSQHLATLRRVGLVATRRECQTIYYRLGNAAASAVIATLHELYCQAPAGSVLK